MKLFFRITVLTTLLLISGCSLSYDSFLMYHIYHSLHPEIQAASEGNHIDPAFLAALISLESNPPGNRNSTRFEPVIYERLLSMKKDGKPFGRLPIRLISELSDEELKALSHSYGLVQIMGYHCISLGCTMEDLTGPDQLRWAAAYMQDHYGRHIKNKDWESCFRIHNTGHPSGETSRKDYVQRGLSRMKVYKGLMQESAVK